MSNLMESLLFSHAKENRLPIKMTLEITPLCNMSCKMCYVRESYDCASDRLKPLDFWLSLIRQLKDSGTLFVALIGGEPMIHPQIREIYEELIANGIMVNLTSNGTLFAEGVPEWMLKHKPRYVTISLYGASNETYQKLTGHPNGYDLTIQGINNLCKAEIPVQLNLCVTNDNYDDLVEILQFAKERNLIINCNTYEFPNWSRKKQNSKYLQNRMSPQEVARAYWTVQKAFRPEEYMSYLKRFADGPYEVETSDYYEQFTCNAGCCTGWVTWRGHLLACGISHEPSMELDYQKNDFSEAWKALTNTISDIRISPECAHCKMKGFCEACPASIKAETESFQGKPEYICQITKAKIHLARKLLANEKDEK